MEIDAIAMIEAVISIGHAFARFGELPVTHSVPIGEKDLKNQINDNACTFNRIKRLRESPILFCLALNAVFMQLFYHESCKYNVEKVQWYDSRCIGKHCKYVLVPSSFAKFLHRIEIAGSPISQMNVH